MLNRKSSQVKAVKFESSHIIIMTDSSSLSLTFSRHPYHQSPLSQNVHSAILGIVGFLFILASWHPNSSSLINNIQTCVDPLSLFINIYIYVS